MGEEIINAEIKNIVSRIIRDFPTKEIFLFGSYASQTHHGESDIDLCIITNREGRTIDLLRQVRRIIAPIANKPVDLVVYNENDFDLRASLNTTFEFKIKNEGIKVYEKS